ncbi:unnamed protein product [Amaranthus hypochondriacus]
MGNFNKTTIVFVLVVLVASNGCLFMSSEAAISSQEILYKLRELFGPDSVPMFKQFANYLKPSPSVNIDNIKHVYCLYLKRIYNAPRATNSIKISAAKLYRKHCLN